MPFKASTTLMLAGALALATGCKDRTITAYRIPKEPVATQSTPNPSAAASTNDLPEGHPPIGAAQASPPAADASPGGGMGSMPNGQPVNVAAGNALVWTAPQHWQTKAPGSIRKGSYNVPGKDGAVADLAITAFPGDTGGLFANVNRWRGQVGLPPITEDKLGEAVEHVDVGDLHIDIVDMLGTANGQATRVLGAIVPHGRETWFFKLTGPDALVAGERDNFRAFLKTIKAP
jgi:hypothetical protein